MKAPSAGLSYRHHSRARTSLLAPHPSGKALPALMAFTQDTLQEFRLTLCTPYRLAFGSLKEWETGLTSKGNFSQFLYQKQGEGSDPLLSSAQHTGFTPGVALLECAYGHNPSSSTTTTNASGRWVGDSTWRQQMRTIAGHPSTKSIEIMLDLRKPLSSWEGRTCSRLHLFTTSQWLSS